jgi:hypothetical protein
MVPSLLETKAPKQRRVLSPRFLGTSKRRLALAYGRVSVEGSQREVWVPISSTNTNCPGSRQPTSMRQSALKNSSLSAAPLDLFFGSCAGVLPLGRASRFAHRKTPDTAKRNSTLWAWVAQGLCWRSLASSFLAFSSSFGLLPGAFLGSKVPRSHRVACRVAFERSAIYPEVSGGL